MNGLFIGMLFAIGFLSLWQSFSATPHFKIPKRSAKKIDFHQWPDVVDDVHSAIRAGLSLPQAIESLGNNSPVNVRDIFRTSTEMYKRNGNFKRSMIFIGQKFNDPIADKFVGAMIIAHELGGTELGKLLSTLGESLRADESMRGEIKARQSWTVNGARLAIAAPWFIVLVLCMRADARGVYFSAQGVQLLLLCGLVTTFAYLLMQKIGKLPPEPKVLDVRL